MEDSWHLSLKVFYYYEYTFHIYKNQYGFLFSYMELGPENEEKRK